MAGRDGTSAGKEGVDFEWVGDGLKTKRFFTRAEKAARSGGGDKPAAAAAAKPKARTSTSTRSSTPAPKPKRDIAAMAEDAIDRSAPTRPKARPGTTRPKARRGDGPGAKTATSVSTPEVTTSKLPARGSSSSGSSATTSSSGKPFAGTKPTKAELDNMSLAQKIRWGVLFSGGSDDTPEAPRKNTRGGGSRGNQAKVGMAKGGMVKANCGASMKPAQKGTKK